MDAYELIVALKERLQEQQSNLAKDSNQIYRAELDTLWACVEVLAQLASGDTKVIVPDWFATNQVKLFPRVDIEPRVNPSTH